MKKINPANLLFKIPLLKERFKEIGVDPYNFIDKTYEDKRYGLSAMRASVVLPFILIVFFMTLITFFRGRSAISKPNFIACATLSLILSYFFSFRNDKYLKYYRQFEKWPKSYKRKYGWYTFTFIVILFYSFYLSVKMSERGILYYLIKAFN